MNRSKNIYERRETNVDRGINAVNGGGNNINRDEIPSTEV